MDSRPVAADTVTREVFVPAAAYSLETIKRAAYRFIDRFSVELFPEETGCRCKVHFVSGTTPNKIEETLRDFYAELLDQDLRRLVASETKGVREAILALAFAPVAPAPRD